MALLTLNLKTLHSLIPFASTEETRWYLNGLFFDYNPETKSYLIISTCGRIMAIFKPENNECDPFESFILSTKDIPSPSSFMKEKISSCDWCAAPEVIQPIIHVQIDTEKQEIVFCQNNHCLNGGVKQSEYDEKGIWKKYTPIDGTYPEYQEAIPKGDELKGNSANVFNIKYISKMASIFPTKTGGAIEFHFSSEDKGASTGRATLPLIGEYFFCLMPMYDSFITEERAALPEWLPNKGEKKNG